MAKKIKITDFPEEITSDGIKIYGETSYENQMAVLSHYLHNNQKKLTKDEQIVIIAAVREFLTHKVSKQSKEKFELSDNDILIAAENPAQYNLFSQFFNIPFPAPKNPKFTFIDLFAGIGGFRIAMQNIGGKCVYSSEFDANAQETYFFNYGEMPFGDITKDSTKSYIPESFDILCGGFPCQAFSIAGYQKGFDDIRGTLFFDVAEIIKEKKPSVVFLENVKNLKVHDNGNTFRVIRTSLEQLGYFVYDKVMSPNEYANIPQNRERIFIIAFNKDKVPNHQEFEFPTKENLTTTIHDCIDESVDDPRFFYTEKMGHYQELKDNITAMDTIYQWRRVYVRENKSNLCPTLTANMGTGGHNVPLILTKKGIRKLTPKECLNFQGYPDNYRFPSTIPISACYKQAGNSVAVPLIQKISFQIWKILQPNL